MTALSVACKYTSKLEDTSFPPSYVAISGSAVHCSSCNDANESCESIVQVGELFIATIAKSGGELRSEQVKAAQKEREEALAVQLIALLKRYVFGDEEGFLVSACRRQDSI